MQNLSKLLKEESVNGRGRATQGHTRGPNRHGSSPRPHMGRFASSEHVGLERTVPSLEGGYRRSHVSSTSCPHTTYFSRGEKFAPHVFPPMKGRSRAGSRLGTGPTLVSESDLIFPELSPGEVVGNRRIPPDHRTTLMDDHRDRKKTSDWGIHAPTRTRSRDFETGMEKAKTKDVSGLRVGSWHWREKSRF